MVESTPRTREDGTGPEIGTYQNVSYWGTNTFSYDKGYNARVMHDYVTPNFKKLVATGQIVNNPMSRTVTECSQTPARTDYTARTRHEPVLNGDGYKHAVGSFPATQKCNDHDSLKDQAITGAWTRVSEGEIDLLASLGEINSTFATVFSCVDKIFSIAWDLKHARFKHIAGELSSLPLWSRKKMKKKFGKSLDKAGNQYLELRYGIRPLLYDIQSALNAAYRSQQPARMTARCTKQGSTIWIENGVEYRDTVRYRAGVLYYADISGDFLSWLTVLGLDKPIDSFYELVPFSFILDWFCNFGDLIKSWTPNPNCQVLASWVTEDRILTAKTLIIAQPIGEHPDWIRATTGLTNGTAQTSVTSRVRSVSPSRPTFPHWDVNLDIPKLFDIAAIIRSFNIGERPTMRR